jgi:hypothetical protein
LLNRRVLIVIDDVWSSEGLQYLLVGGPTCGTLLTTRDARAVDGTQARIVQAEQLDPLSARLIIQRRLGELAAPYKLEQLDKLCWLLGYHPLALELSTTHLLEGLDLEVLLIALEQELHRLKVLEVGGQPSEGAKIISVNASLNLSVARLQIADLAHLLLLATLRAQEKLSTPKAASVVSNLPEVDAQIAMNSLAAKSLLSWSGRAGKFGRLMTMHDLIRDKCLLLLLRKDASRPIPASIPSFSTASELSAFVGARMSRASDQFTFVGLRCIW